MGTTEPETAVFFGIEEATHGLFLGSWKISSENVEDLVPCFRQAADQFGQPDEVLHDLSPTISGAGEQALPGVAHRVCHQHLARDIGEDLYAAPQAALGKRLRTLKLQYRLKQQRQGQNEWLRQRLDSPADLVLAEVLAGRTVALSWDDTFSREILLAFHFWILDDRSDGASQGAGGVRRVTHAWRRVEPVGMGGIGNSGRRRSQNDDVDRPRRINATMPLDLNAAPVSG